MKMAQDVRPGDMIIDLDRPGDHLVVTQVSFLRDDYDMYVEIRTTAWTGHYSLTEGIFTDWSEI